MVVKSWLWPDHAISKGESRRLREEHNEAVNLSVDLLAALLECEGALTVIKGSHLGPCESCDNRAGFVIRQARAAIAKAEGR